MNRILSRDEWLHCLAETFNKTFMEKDMENNIPMRDYFAAKAMQGFAANPEFSGWTNKEMAERAYDWADAMLEVRED